jgi:membrane-bound lytic murein transglycosylase F
MQVLPRTAATLGYRDLRNPADAVRAGVQYLDALRDRFEPQLPIAERNWFALAAYHAGYDRVRRARARAARLGLNPDRWFGHVEAAMARYARIDPSLRHTIAYVREIQACYDAYRQVAPALHVAAVTAPVTDKS